MDCSFTMAVEVEYSAVLNGITRFLGISSVDNELDQDR